MRNCKNCGHRKNSKCLLSGCYYETERKYPTRCGKNFEGWTPKEDNVFIKLIKYLIRQIQHKGEKMNFGDAIEALKQGKRVAREGWNGKGMFLFLTTEIEFKTDADLSPLQNTELKQPNSIAMKTAQDEFVVGWLASQSDMLAEDWVIVE